VRSMNIVVMSVCTEEMKVSTRHQESRSAMLASRHGLLPSNVASSVNTTGLLVNKMEMSDCILGYLDCSLDFVASNSGLSVSSLVMTDCSLEKLESSLGSLGSSLD